MQIRPLKRSDTTWSDDTELANVTYNDKYVVVYDFGNVGTLSDCSSTQQLADNG
jgi:anoctamin-10